MPQELRAGNYGELEFILNEMLLFLLAETATLKVNDLKRPKQNGKNALTTTAAATTSPSKGEHGSRSHLSPNERSGTEASGL